VGVRLYCVGQCGGDGTTCSTVRGSTNERRVWGYNSVVAIPAGATNIDVRQHGYDNRKDDDNYLGALPRRCHTMQPSKTTRASGY